MGVFYNLTCPSKWVLFQTFNTHIRVENVQVAPPGVNVTCFGLMDINIYKALMARGGHGPRPPTRAVVSINLRPVCRVTHKRTVAVGQISTGTTFTICIIFSAPDSGDRIQ